MNDLDRLIDGALSTYAPGPTPGLEQRVLNRVRRPSRWWMPLIAVAAAVAVFVAMPEPAEVSPPALIIHLPGVPVLPSAAVSRSSVAKTAAKPEGIPLSPQERQLEKFAQAYPELARQVLVEAPKQMNDPVIVLALANESIEPEPIVIQPLENVAPDFY